MGRTIKRKASKILSLSMALVLMGSFNPLHVSAQEHEVEGSYAVDDMEVSLADICGTNEELVANMEVCLLESEGKEVDLMTAVEGLKAEVSGEVPALYAAEILPADTVDGIQTFAADNRAGQDSTLSYGTLSDYLAEAGAYKLYSLNISAGDYLQARLTVPNNVNINYALVIFDSELNILKQSDYASSLNGGKAMEESVGYLCTADRLIYIGVLSLMGGSTTEAFTLDFSVTTNFSENGEPNENVLEAAGLNLGNSGAAVSGKLNSPVDNDWYSFNVIDNPKYYKIRLNLTSSSSTNGCKMEIYKNVGTGNLSMQLVGSGSGEGELTLPAGTYYVRIISKNTLNNFNPADIPLYNFSVVPVSKVSGIQFTNYYGNDISMSKIFYYNDEKPGHRIVNNYPNNYYGIRGMVTYKDSPSGAQITATNIKLKGAVMNLETNELTYGTAVSDENGFFTMVINFGDVVGGRQCYVGGETHYYDYMRISIWPEYNTKIETTEYFYVLKEITY